MLFDTNDGNVEGSDGSNAARSDDNERNGDEDTSEDLDLEGFIDASNNLIPQYEEEFESYRHVLAGIADTVDTDIHGFAQSLLADVGNEQHDENETLGNLAPFEQMYPESDFATAGTIKRIKSYNAYWVRFMCECHPTQAPYVPQQGLGLLKRAHILVGNVGDSMQTSLQWNLDQKLVNDFIQWIIQDIESRLGACSSSFINAACLFLQTHLNGEAVMLGADYTQLKDAIRTQLVKNILRRVHQQKKDHMKRLGIDLQAKLDIQITREQHLEVVRNGLLSTHNSINNLSWLGMVASFLNLSATLGRGEDV
jgi:hypothetical protein